MERSVNAGSIKMTQVPQENIELVQTLHDGTPRYSQTVPLSGINYRMEFDWNSRDSHWYFSLYDTDGVPISGYASRKLVVNWGVSQFSTDPNRPLGVFYIYSTKHADPILDNLGTNVLQLFIRD